MIALLPMKGNSERVAGKNIKELNGLPLFFHIADTLNKSKLFSVLAINTDSEKISDLAKKRYGDWVHIIERPVSLCGDYVSMNEIISYDLSQLMIEEDFFQTHSTNPFLKLETLINAHKIYFSKMKENNFNCIFSVNSIKTRLYDSKLNPINHNADKLERTQDLDDIYEENSNFYFFSRSSFFEKNHRIGSKPMPFVMDRNSLEALDIDDMSDWNLAELVFK